ncbi:hypothetical protein, partial [Oligella urethralis]|uniref:hypothetical protein n=1 Tax=Oligella urethralis TaxID=90245 RepID=UPI001E3EC6A6
LLSGDLHRLAQDLRTAQGDHILCLQRRQAGAITNLCLAVRDAAKSRSFPNYLLSIGCNKGCSSLSCLLSQVTGFYFWLYQPLRISNPLIINKDVYRQLQTNSYKLLFIVPHLSRSNMVTLFVQRKKTILLIRIEIQPV